MRVKLITLSFSPSLGRFDDQALDAFTASREILSVREHFFEAEGLPHLVCLVHYRDAAHAAPAVEPRPAAEPADAPRARTPRIDLSTEELPAFETLRDWRRRRAHKDGVPPYVIATNRELAAVVRARPLTATALRGVEGFGEAKVAKYGDDILARLGAPARSDASATNGVPAAPPPESTEPAS